MGLRAILNLPRGINVLLLYHLSSSREEIHQDLRKRGVTKPNGWQFYLAMLSKGPTEMCSTIELIRADPC